LAEGSGTAADTVCDLYPLVEEETEADEEEDEEEEEEEEDMMEDETSAVDLVTAESTQVIDDAELLDADAAEQQLSRDASKEMSDVDLRSVDLQSGFEPELQLIASGELQRVPSTDVAQAITSQTKVSDAVSASSQVFRICSVALY